MMNKENLDRIVVSSNEKMGKIIMWYLDNQSWLDMNEFRPPMDTGLIILEEEGIEVTFESKPPVVELAVYPDSGTIPVMTYDYDPKRKNIAITDSRRICRKKDCRFSGRYRRLTAQTIKRLSSTTR